MRFFWCSYYSPTEKFAIWMLFNWNSALCSFTEQFGISEILKSNGPDFAQFWSNFYHFIFFKLAAAVDFVQLIPKYQSKVKLCSWQFPKIFLPEIVRQQENEWCGENLAWISNWHLHMGIAAKCSEKQWRESEQQLTDNQTQGSTD